MNDFTIRNGCNYPITFQQGTIPNMSEAMTDWFQNLQYVQLTKTVVGFQLLETTTPVNFWGVIMPLSPRELQILPIGERAWSLYRLYAQPQLSLKVDDVIILSTLNNKQTRVMSIEDFSLYSYKTFTLCEDYIESGPPTP